MQLDEKKYKVNFGDYEVAGASYGDIIKLFSDETPRGHILLVDPKGHDPKEAKEVSKFLDEQIKEGKFGNSQNPTTELSRLSRLALESQCPDFAASYFQIPRGDEVFFVSAFIPFPIKIKAKKNSFHYQKILGGMYIPEYTRSPSYKIKMEKGDILILYTDGFSENIDLTLGGNNRLLDNVRDQENELIAIKDKEKIAQKVKAHHDRVIKKRNKLFSTFFKRNSEKSSSEILDVTINTLGSLFIPRTKDDDDAAIVIIKKNQ